MLLGSITSDKAYYIQEKASVQQDVFIRNIQPIVAEMSRLLQSKSAGESKVLRSSFSEEKEIEMLKTNHKFKLSIRSILGLAKASISSLSNINKDLTKSPPIRDQSWIYHLNIGNVMHLMPMTLEDLSKLEFLSKRDLFNIGEGSPHSLPEQSLCSPY